MQKYLAYKNSDVYTSSITTIHFLQVLKKTPANLIQANHLDK